MDGQVLLLVWGSKSCLISSNKFILMQLGRQYVGRIVSSVIKYKLWLFEMSVSLITFHYLQSALINQSSEFFPIISTQYFPKENRTRKIQMCGKITEKPT